MTTLFRNIRPLCAIVVLALCACDMSDVYEGQIRKASRAIETARKDNDRAAAYADRGRGYSDKARYLMFRKAIDHDEYVRLFSLAVKDHDQAVALDPNNAELFFKRGLSYYDRAAQANEVGFDHKPWFDSARADFSRAIEKNPRHDLAYDYLGLVDEQTDRLEDAIVDFTHEMALNPRMGRSRLADLYCNRGQSLLREKRYDPAVADLEKSVELGVAADGCSCEPYNSLAFVYIDVKQQYDKGWDLVHKARRSMQMIAPEYVERLKTASGRNG